jgi:AcrR family transcriptional regulator
VHVSTVARPLRADAERNRERILVSARQLFTERGLHVSLDEVAERAGLGVATVYRRFASRGELIDAVFSDQVDAIVASAEEALAIDDPWAAFEYLVTDSVERSARDRGLKELVLGSPEGRAHVTRVREEMRPRVEEIVARAQAAGVLRSDFASTDLMMVQMMVGAVADVGGEELWRRCLTLLLDGLRAPGASPLSGTPLDFEDLDEVMCKWRPPRR